MWSSLMFSTVATSALSWSVVSSWKLDSSMHIQLDVVAEQIQRRRAEIAADRDTFAGRRSHLAHQGGDRAFRVGSADGHDWRLRIAREQLDVAGQFHATGGRFLQSRGRQRQAGADVQLVGAAQEFDVQLATAHFHLRVVTA